MTERVTRAWSPYYLGGALLVICLVGFALRCYEIGTQSVWIDEGLSLRLAALSPAEIVHETSIEEHPPAYFLLLWAWMRPAPFNETWARLLSALLGAALIPVIYLFAREILPTKGALLAAGLVAVSPMAVWHSQDVRGYTLALLASYFAFSQFLGFLRTGNRVQLGLFALALMIALYTHLYAISALPVILWYLLIKRREMPRERLVRAFVAALVVGIAWLPWALVVTRVPHAAGFPKPLTLLTLPYALYVFSVGYTLGPSIGELRQVVGTAMLPTHHLPVILSVAVAFGTAFLFGVTDSLTSLGRKGLLLLLLLTIPLALPVLVTLVVPRIDFNVRYAFLSLPAYLLLLAAGLIRIRMSAVRGMVTGALGILTCASLLLYYTDIEYAKDDVRGAFRLVEEQRAPGDCLLVLGVTPAFQYYEKFRGTSVSLNFKTPEKASRAKEVLSHWPEQCNRLWFVSARTWEDDPLGLGRAATETYFEPMQEFTLHGVRVSLMRAPAGASAERNQLRPKHLAGSKIRNQNCKIAIQDTSPALERRRHFS